MTELSVRVRTLRLAVPERLQWPLAFLFLNLPVLTAGLLWLVAFPADWELWEQLPERIGTHTLYDHGPVYNWVWSPIAAWLLAYAVVPLGYGVLMAVRTAVLPLLGWRLAALTVLSLPFWVDAINGNLFVFSVVAGVLALRGNRWGALAYLALTCIMPRPVQFPLAAWLVWRHPETRWPFAAMVTASLIVLLATGYATDWLSVLVSLAGGYGTPEVNLGPSRMLGVGWLIIGLPLSVWLTITGRVGWAGMALSPYLVPQYLLAILWEMPRASNHVSPTSAATEVQPLTGGWPQQVRAPGR
jgi:hypothetical protein